MRRIPPSDDMLLYKTLGDEEFYVAIQICNVAIRRGEVDSPCHDHQW